MIGFGKFGKRRELGIFSTEDARLLLIDPTSDGFFENVLDEYDTENKHVKEFIKAVKEVKYAEIGKFWRPIYDPSIEGGEVVFKAGNPPAVGHSFNFWKQEAEDMPTVDDKHWSVGFESQYYAFLVWLVNSKVKNGWNVKKALDAVVVDSKEMGHYLNSDGALGDRLELTGSREVCRVYDLANTTKLLACTNEKAGFWTAAGTNLSNSHDFPLADLEYRSDVDRNYVGSVGWLVLS